MGGKKSVDVQAPEFAKDPLLQQDRGSLSETFRGLTGGDFLDESSDLGFLAPLTQRDPEMTSLALEEAQGLLGPQFAQDQQDLQNQIIRLGGGTSSTLGDALARQQGAQQSQFQGITAGAALADRQSARSNILNLFGTGLNVGGQSVSAGLESQQQRNAFNQQNFENQLALNQLNQSNKGGLAGGITGGIGGAALGIALAPLTGGLSLGLTAALAAGGGAAGAMGSKGTGGQILSAGAGAAGSQFGGASRFAQNNAFSPTIAGNPSGLIGGGNTDVGLLSLLGGK